ncbi:MAG TPA: SDR family oxidoreductase [Roseiarcus sp.]|nr:SDR family oxidoreductase [Roseiarcus sp.]
MGEFSTRAPHEPLATRAKRATPVHEGKTFVVTGGAGGIGRATGELLIAEGARVALADVRRSALDATIAEIADPNVLALTLDAADPASIAAALHEAEGRFGRIDGLVNCAAIVRHVDPLATPWSDWEKIFAVNVFGAYEAARLAAKSMIARGVRGAIVNVASEAGKKGHKESLAYSASKAALISVTRMLSAALAPHDINVNCVCPGGVATDMLRDVAVAYGRLANAKPDEVFPQLVSSQLLRHIEPQEVARTISFLLSDDALIIRGQAINADGGDTPY